MSLFTKTSVLLQLIFKPYTNRLKLGEGGLVVFNVVHAFASPITLAVALIQSAISLIVMCLLYGYNDYTDADADKLNPKKDLEFIEIILHHKKTYLYLIVLLQFITIVTCFLVLGWGIALCLAVLYGINFLYSTYIKSMPILDILIVCLWGGVYACLAGELKTGIALAAGLMTGIAHLFQVITDEKTDKENNINTSAVVLAQYKNLLLLFMCVLLALLIFSFTHNWIAVAGFAPFLMFMFSKNVTFSWFGSRAVFLLLWMIILNAVYAII